MVRAGKAMKGSAVVRDGISDEAAALYKEEAARRELEAKKARWTKLLELEQEFSKRNKTKINNQWRKILREMKVEEMKKEIEIISQSHEREVDRKDAIIQMLDRDLEDAEDQFRVALRGHLTKTQLLQDLQADRIKALRRAYNNDLSALMYEFGEEKRHMMENHATARGEMQTMINAMIREFDTSNADARAEFESFREEIKNRDSEEYNVLKISLESYIDDLERHFESAHEAYLTSTDDRTKAYRELMERDEISARIIERRMRKLSKLLHSLGHWRSKQQVNVREWEDRNEALRAEKNMITTHFEQLKKDMNAFRNDQRALLTQTCVHAKDSLDGLQEKLELGHRILQQAELNRKMETELEKIRPFRPEPADGAAAVAEIPPVGAGVEGEEGEEEWEKEERERGEKKEEGVRTWQELEKFYERVNSALLDKTEIDMEKDRIAAENADLRVILKQYLDGISVTPTVVSNPVNPLLVVNQRLKVKAPDGGTQQVIPQIQQQIVEQRR